jgi:hypothetical protein
MKSSAMKISPRLARLAITGVLCIAIAGCTGTPVTFKTLTDQHYDMNKGRTITASACDIQLLLIIPIKTKSRLAAAYEELMQKAGQDAVTDIKIQESWYYAYLGTIYCTDLQATAYPRTAITQRPVAPQARP